MLLILLMLGKENSGVPFGLVKGSVPVLLPLTP